MNKIPPIDLSDNSTGCCPRFKPDGWDRQELHFDEQLFVKASVRCLFHIPLNIGGMFSRVQTAIEQADAGLSDTYLVLSHATSLWQSDHYFAVSKPVPSEEMVTLSGDYLTQVFEGSFSDAGKWNRELKDYVKRQNRKLLRSYFFYTTCPACAKTYGNNYVVGVAHVKSQ